MAAVVDHFDQFYGRLGQLLAADAVARAAFARCDSDLARVANLDAFLAKAGVRLQPHSERSKDDQLAEKLLEGALGVARLRHDFEKDSEDEETSNGYLSKELFFLGGAIRTGTLDGDVVQKALLARADLLAHLGHFDDALLDCQGVRTCSEDTKLQCQLAVIKSACLARSSRPEAEGAIKSALGALSRSQVDKADKAGLTMRLVQQMKELAACEARRPKCESRFDAECPALLLGPHPTIPNVSSAVELRHSEDRGRFLVANTAIEVGSVLIVDEPYAWMLTPAAWQDHCTHCCKPVMAFLPCPRCSQVCFCSEECRSAAQREYHDAECGLLHHFASSNELSAMALLVVRVAARARAEDADLARVEAQVANSSARPVGDLIKRTATALFLGRALRANGLRLKGDEPHRLEATLLRHLQSCSCNAYEISEHVEALGQSSSGEVVAIGGAVYPSISLANHSCWGNLCRTSHGRRCVVRATRHIAPGEELLDNYGYCFLSQPRADRRYALRKQYFFECQCVACAEDWPLFPQLPPDAKYRCGRCDKVIGLKPACKNCSPKGAAKTVERELRLAYDRCQVAIAKIKAHTVDESVEQWLKEYVSEMQYRVVMPSRELLIAQQALIKAWGLQANRNQVLALNEA